MQVCTNLELLLGKRVAVPQSHQLELTTNEGQPVVALPPPSGPVPKVIVWSQRFFLRSSIDGRYRECYGYHARPALRQGGKTAKMMQLLQRPGGASLKQLMTASGWQAHSVRALISGTLRRKLGLTVASTKNAKGQCIYSIHT
jgi:hypothetical protein